MQFAAIPGWAMLLVFVGFLSPIMAQGPGCSSWPLLTGVCC